MCFVLHHLATNVDCQDKLYEECKRLLPSPFSHVCKDVLSEAKYAKAVLKESLRLRPVSVGVGRILAQNAVFSGYDVPEGVRRLISLSFRNFKRCNVCISKTCNRII